MSRAIRDNLLKVTKALPAAAANSNSGSIDLEQASAFPINEGFDVELAVPALPDLVEAKTVIFTFQDSADDSSFAAITGLSTLTITGGSGDGAAAVTRKIRLPSLTRRYVNVNAAVLTAGGDNTGVSYTLSLLL
jgi:hypothetical protein